MIWQIMSYTYFQCNKKKNKMQIAHKNFAVASVFFSDNKVQFQVTASFGQLTVELPVV